MKVVLVNPAWTFDGSVYFGCREPHLPLELAYTQALLRQRGHAAVLIDAALENLPNPEVVAQIASIQPDMIVISTAPSYLFWRCPQPELRVPMRLIRDLRDLPAQMVAVGPHGSSTPVPVLRKLGVDAVVMGECEAVIPKLADAPVSDWCMIRGVCQMVEDVVHIHGLPQAVKVELLPALQWDASLLRRHRHHHHRFDSLPNVPGAEVEASRGCPYGCGFCAKRHFRNRYRRRPDEIVLQEIDGLIAGGAGYVYFIDELFMPNSDLLRELERREIAFGVQTRLDLWEPEMIDALGKAGCVSIEAGIECISEAGRESLGRSCSITLQEMTARLIQARQHVPFVQANLIHVPEEDADEVERWRQELMQHQVWANKPVPMFPFPGSPAYEQLWGPPDDFAWERAHEHYLLRYNELSDIQDQHPLPLVELELLAHGD